MISIQILFESIKLPWKGFRSRMKKKSFPTLPMNPNRKSINRIKELNHKLSNINTHIQKVN